MLQSQVPFQVMELYIRALYSHGKRMKKGNFLTWTIPITTTEESVSFTSPYTMSVNDAVRTGETYQKPRIFFGAERVGNLGWLESRVQMVLRGPDPGGIGWKVALWWWVL